MNKKIIIIFCAMIIVIAILLMTRKNNNMTHKDDVSTNDVNQKSISTNYNEETKEYDIFDENGMLITSVKSAGEIDFYIRNPDYRATPPVTESNIDPILEE